MNEILKACGEGADATDYVSIRRYLIDYHILDREDSGKILAALTPGPFLTAE